MEQKKHPNWEQRTIEKIALAGINEQKRTRRWGIFFKSLFFVYVTIMIVAVVFKTSKTPLYDTFGQEVSPLTKEHIALIRLSGVISDDQAANAELLSATLRKAMHNDTVKGVVLLANSPGGSPVQSSLVYQTIRTLKEQYKKPILTAVTDICASGCYYIAAATDEIYADASSVVGSIGVISQSFGYEQAAKKLGIEPRTFTAGKNKDLLNPARPISSEELVFFKTLLDDLHQNFISAVKVGRGDKLSNDPELFSGLFWTGGQAQELGLIDGLAPPIQVAKKIGDYPVYDYSQQDPLEKVLERIGVQGKAAVSKGIQQALTSQQQIKFQ